MEIGICTSFYNGYGKYFPRWLASIISLEKLPAQIAVVASGADNGLYDDVENMGKFSICKGMMSFLYLPEHISMGYARNRAVSLLDTEYVMYLDVDDEILTNALSVYEKYEGYDVISGGLRIRGDREHKDLIFKASRRRQLRGRHCCCSHAVYKKSLWEKSRYIEKNDYIEQPLWAKFAMDGASFTATKEVTTVYNTSKTGHNMSLSDTERKEARHQKMKILRKEIDYETLLL